MYLCFCLSWSALKLKTSTEKKRKGKPFSGKQRYDSNQSNASDMLTSQPGSQQTLESNEASNETVLSASRRKLKLSETAEKLALEASQSIDYGGQGYHLIDINKLASSVSEAHVWYYGLAIRQNTVSSPNPTDKDVAISVYAMKKNQKTSKNSIDSVLLGLTPGANGNRIKL